MLLITWDKLLILCDCLLIIRVLSHDSANVPWKFQEVVCKGGHLYKYDFANTWCWQIKKFQKLLDSELFWFDEEDTNLMSGFTKNSDLFIYLTILRISLIIINSLRVFFFAINEILRLLFICIWEISIYVWNLTCLIDYILFTVKVRFVAIQWYQKYYRILDYFSGRVSYKRVLGIKHRNSKH